jgi:CBS domain-containing protein
MHRAATEVKGPMHVPVRDLMTAVPHVLPPTATIVEAARLMPSADVGSILVMGDDDLVGIVTDRDLIVRGIATGTAAAVASVAEVLSHPPVRIRDLLVANPPR